MAMINYCKDCGLVLHCRSCNPICPQCGGEVVRQDLIKYQQKKKREEKFVGKND